MSSLRAAKYIPKGAGWDRQQKEGKESRLGDPEKGLGWRRPARSHGSDGKTSSKESMWNLCSLTSHRKLVECKGGPGKAPVL